MPSSSHPWAARCRSGSGATRRATSSSASSTPASASRPKTCRRCARPSARSTTPGRAATRAPASASPWPRPWWSCMTAASRSPAMSAPAPPSSSSCRASASCAATCAWPRPAASPLRSILPPLPLAREGEGEGVVLGPALANACWPRYLAAVARQERSPRSMLFAAVLKSIIRSGHLRLIDGAGRAHDVGDRTPPRCTIRLARRRLDYTLAFNPALSVGEAYMDGLLTIEEGTLYDFLEIAARNYGHLQGSTWYKLVNTVARRLKQYNPVGRAQRNVAHHYDLSDQLYDLFLDRDRQYSCAHFAAESDSLETAQENKKRHIASKLMLDRQRLKVLDIGSGWGGLGLYLAQEAGAD